MTALRTTVIAKTDIVESTQRIAGLSESELTTMLSQHKRLISDVVSRNEGSIIKGEGDAFWLVFPSVTTATLAAIEMHDKLRVMQVGMGDEKRLAIRVAIAVGDVLHQDEDIFGSAVVLTARIEGVTPPDEIYLSHAAWLVLNKAEVPTVFVNAFTLKGIREPERVYKVERKHRTRVVADQAIVFADVRGFTDFARANAITDVEGFLLGFDDRINEICENYGGVIRNAGGDNYFLTFPEVDHALTAVEMLLQQWKSVTQRYHMGLSVGVHQGDVNILRSYVYGHDINTTALLERLNSIICPEKDQSSVLVSQKVKDGVQGTRWEQRLQGIEGRYFSSDLAQAMIDECGVYRLIVDAE